jgi:hypothetical protein
MTVTLFRPAAVCACPRGDPKGRQGRRFAPVQPPGFYIPKQDQSAMTQRDTESLEIQIYLERSINSIREAVATLGFISRSGVFDDEDLENSVSFLFCQLKDYSNDALDAYHRAYRMGEYREPKPAEGAAS